MNVQPSPIGIFDSGLGGLSVAIELETLLPGERLLYAADSLYCPYGSRTEEEIRERSLIIGNALIERGAKVLVIACNTATAFALEALRSTFDIPIIGLEPALKPAVARTRNGRVGILATPRTASSDRLQRLVDRYGTDMDVRVVPAHGFVELVEEDAIHSDAAHRLIAETVAPLVEGDIDTVVLGCTHYPFLRTPLQRALGGHVALVDSGAAIARRVNEVLRVNGLASEEHIPGGLHMLTTGDVTAVERTASRLLDRQVSVQFLETPTVFVRRDYAFSSAPANTSSACTVSTSAGA